MHPDLGEVAPDDDRAVPVHVQRVHHAVHAVAGREGGIQFAAGAVEHRDARAEGVAHEQKVAADDDAAVRHAIHGVDRAVRAFTNVKQRIQRPVLIQAGHGIAGLGVDLVEIANDDDPVVELHQDVEHLAVDPQAGVERLVHRAVVVQPSDAPAGLAVERREPTAHHGAGDQAGLEAARQILIDVADADRVDEAVGPHAGLERGIENAKLANTRHPVHDRRVDRGEVAHDIHLFLLQRGGGIGRLGLDDDVVHVVIGQGNKIQLTLTGRFVVVDDGDGGPVLHPEVGPRLVDFFLHIRLVRIIRIIRIAATGTGIIRNHLLLVLGEVQIGRLEIVQHDHDVLVELGHLVVDDLDINRFRCRLVCVPAQFAGGDMEVAHDIPHVHGKVKRGVEHPATGRRGHIRARVQDDLRQADTIVARLGDSSKCVPGKRAKPHESARQGTRHDSRLIPLLVSPVLREGEKFIPVGRNCPQVGRGFHDLVLPILPRIIDTEASVWADHVANLHLFIERIGPLHGNPDTDCPVVELGLTGHPSPLAQQIPRLGETEALPDHERVRHIRPTRVAGVGVALPDLVHGRAGGVVDAQRGAEQILMQHRLHGRRLAIDGPRVGQHHLRHRERKHLTVPVGDQRHLEARAHLVVAENQRTGGRDKIGSLLRRDTGNQLGLEPTVGGTARDAVIGDSAPKCDGADFTRI